MKNLVKSALKSAITGTVYGAGFVYGCGKAIVDIAKNGSDSVITNVDEETGEVITAEIPIEEQVTAVAKETAENIVTAFKEWCTDFYSNHYNACQIISGLCIGFFVAIAVVTATSCIMAIA